MFENIGNSPTSGNHVRKLGKFLCEEKGVVSNGKDFFLKKQKDNEHRYREIFFFSSTFLSKPCDSHQIAIRKIR